MPAQQSRNGLQMQDTDVTRCINNCLNTARVCLETLHYALNSKSLSGKHIELLQTCAETCQLSAKLMIADSAFHHQACELCFEVCEACATECERFDDEQLLRCAQACRRSEESCRGMAGMTVRMSANMSPGASARM